MSRTEPRVRSSPTLSTREILRIDRIVPGGRGFARTSSGKPIFVRGALPGDEIELLEVRDKKSFWEAERFELVTPSPERTIPSCADVRVCGGCDLMELNLSGQQRVKLGILQEALARTGGFSLEALPEVQIHSPGPHEEYRVRIRLQVASGRVGFYSAASHELVEVGSCRVARPEVRALLDRLRGVVRAAPRDFDGVQFAEVRVLPPRSRAAEESPASRRSRSSIFIALRPGGALSKTARRKLAELDAFAEIRVAGEPSRVEQTLWVTEEVFVLVPVGGFCQVHDEVNRSLVREVIHEVTRIGARSFLDLYCGSGNFSLPLAFAGLDGRGIEVSSESIDAARRGAEQQGLSQVEFEAGDVTRALDHLLKRGALYDSVLVDPPRSGAKSALEALARLARRQIVLISCDPVTLARDLKVLVALGFEVERIAAWDMFPQTHHVESLVVLKRAQPL